MQCIVLFSTVPIFPWLTAVVSSDKRGLEAVYDKFKQDDAITKIILGYQ